MDFPLFPNAAARTNKGGPGAAWQNATFRLAHLALFALPKDETCTDLQSFVRAVNSLTMINRVSGLRVEKLPADLSVSVSASGDIDWSVEVLHFGNWLLVDGRPGASKTRGKHAEDIVVFRTIAVALAERFSRQKREKDPTTTIVGKSGRIKTKTAGKKITRLDLSKRWDTLFRERVPADKFKPRINTAQRILSDYISHLANTSNGSSGPQPMRSRELEHVLKALSSDVGLKAKLQSQNKGAHKASQNVLLSQPRGQIAHATPLHASSAKPSALNVPLVYSSDVKCVEYRASGSVPIPQTTLCYDVLSADTYGTSGGTLKQKRFANKVVFVPDFTLKDSVSVKAVIDRMIICFVTTKVTSAQHVQSEVAKLTGADCFVEDLNGSRGAIDWRGHKALPTESVGVTDSGRVFAVLIQEPTPVMMEHIAQLILSRWGIVGLMRPFLLELALDFRVRQEHDLQKRIELREKMVGLIQRHHRCIGAGLANAESDARQFYEDANAKPSDRQKTVYLFPKVRGTSRKNPDTEITSDDVRSRLQRPLTNTLWLDATIYAGRDNENLLFRTQHKISDKRNKKTRTFTTLKETERRARVEVEISGYEKLGAELALISVQDLKAFNFRKVRKSHLSFWLPTAPSDLVAQKVAREQLTQRGIYGVEIIQSLERHKNKKAGVSVGRQGSGDTNNLVAWQECNERVGDALDGLRKRWRAFSV